MERERVKIALARIEAAAARIEAAASRAHSPSDEGLAQKHAALKASVGQSLRELDDLIARLEA